jgi:hypothetical protein
MSNSTLMPSVDKQDWAQAADKAKEAAAFLSEMASRAASAVGAMASQAASNVGKNADDLTASAGVGIQGMGDKLSKNTPQAGVLGSLSQAVARTVTDGGEYLEGAKLSGMTEDIVQLIRRNPVPAVLIGIGLGWFAWRKLRS